VSGLDDEARACSVALAALSGVGPARLRALLEHAGDAVSAWAAVRSGALDGVDLRRTTGRAELVSELQQAAPGRW